MNATHAITRVTREEMPALMWKLGAVAALAALGDFLLFGHLPGLGGALFTAAVETAAVLAAGASGRKAIVCAIFGATTLAPLVEDANVLSISIAVVGAGTIALIANAGVRGDFVGRSLQVLRFLAVAPFSVLFDLPVAAPHALRGGIGGRALIGWILPIGLGAIFLALFSAANPVIEGWLSNIDLRWLLAILDIRRIAFWLLLVALVWPFVFFRSLAQGTAAQRSPEAAAELVRTGLPGALARLLFGTAPTLRSLVLFNAMFGVQTALDAAILGRGEGLPAGVSFAAYAHRGAYPLMATALLAAGFVVLAMRRGSEASRSTPIRALVYLWVAQNIALVISSIYRLDLYVGIYSLTYWRVAAFIWTSLVAIGLVLIIVQMSTRRSNRWLLSANVVSAAAALYLSAFVNFDDLIADYNLRHCAEVSGESAKLDIDYLRSLGAGAIPALDAALAAPVTYGPLRSIRSAMEADWRSRDGDWRSWSLRGWRISRYLETGAAPKL